MTHACACHREVSESRRETPVIEADRTVAEVARDCPRAIEAMGALGINHCCGGGLTLAEAAASAGIPLERLLEALAVARVGAA